MDAQHRRVKKNFGNKPITNFGITNWVKELEMKHFDVVFNKGGRQWEYNCGITNLDSNNGQGHIGHVMLILFILIPLDYHHPKISFLSNDTILYNIKKKKKKKRYPFFVVTFIFFSLKDSKIRHFV